MTTVWQSCLGSGWTSTVTIAQSLCSSFSVWLSWILLHGCQSGLLLLFTWVVKEKYRLLKPFSCSRVYSHTNHTTGGKLHVAGVPTGL